MGRKPIGKAAMTAAERQRRRRSRLRREQVKADKAARRKQSPYVTLPYPILRFGEGWDQVPTPTPPPTKEELADELVRQIVEAIHLEPGLTLEDVGAAIRRAEQLSAT